jgi:hypothetical protein
MTSKTSNRIYLSVGVNFAAVFSSAWICVAIVLLISC